MKPIVYVIVGATATGKTKLAIEIAKNTDGEVISADSMQVYREMNIGTAKPNQYEMEGVVHHMIDICDPDYSYSVAEYQNQALSCIEMILAKNKTPIIAGGSGLYINSLTFNLDFSAAPGSNKFRNSLAQKSNEELYYLLKQINSEAAERIHINNRVRVIRALEITKNGKSDKYNFNKQNEKYNFRIIGLRCERPVLYERINERVERMLGEGLEGEVRYLYEKYGETPTAFQGIGYKEFISYFNGICDYRTTVDKIKQHSRNLAKRQGTWFNRDDRIVWYDLPESGSWDTDYIIDSISI